MNQLLLSPTDVLFFRDGRPLGGSSIGHGDAWPLPTVTNAALHAALWRSGLAETARTHVRRQGRARSNGNERFGSLTTAGPFPVCTNGKSPTWFFPRPLDADCAPTQGCSQLKIRNLARPTAPLPGGSSSNPLPFSVAAETPPSKEPLKPWWSEGAWNSYLGSSPRGDDSNQRELNGRHFTQLDSEFSDSEANIGIGIDPTTGTQDGESFYAAHYLRLREGWGLGVFAETSEKFEDPAKHGQRNDLIKTLFDSSPQMLVGGQQRLCTATCESLQNSRLPIPLGRTTGFHQATIIPAPNSKPQYLVKWVLLSPAIFPHIEGGESTDTGQVIVPHRGGWLPSWIMDDDSHQVLLRAPLAPRDVANESRESYRKSVRSQPPVGARLVAALVGKSLPVTGWSLGTPDDPSAPPRNAGAKSTHLAVPAGSVYFFSCESAVEATKLATVLNWHGDTPGTQLRNRRSALLGEKGFGLGVCASWTPLT